jgi:hypothetical protein
MKLIPKLILLAAALFLPGLFYTLWVWVETENNFKPSRPEIPVSQPWTPTSTITWKYQIGREAGKFLLVRLFPGEKQLNKGWSANGFFPKEDSDIMHFDTMEEVIDQIEKDRQP